MRLPRSVNGLLRMALRAQRPKAQGAKGERRELARHRDRYIDALLRLDGPNCHDCGVLLIARCHVDHTWPVSRDGKTEVRNLSLMCARCNGAKADTLPRRWRRRPCCERHAWAWVKGARPC